MATNKRTTMSQRKEALELRIQLPALQMKNLVSSVVDSAAAYWYYYLVLVDAKGFEPLLHI